MPFPALKEAEDKLAAKNAELDAIFEQAGQNMDFKAVTRDLPAGVKAGDSHAIASLVRKLNDEATAYGKELENLKGTDAAYQESIKRRRNGRTDGGATESGDGTATDAGKAWGGDGASQISVGDLFVKSSAFKDLKGRKVGELSTLDTELKTLMQTSAGWAPETTRTGRLVDFATRPLQVAQLIPTTTTSQNAVTYMEETTFTNAATEIAEGGTYPEATLALTEQSSLVRKISVFLPVTDEQLQDETQVRGYIDNRLGFMVRQRLDLQILVGNGTAPNLRGLLNIVGIQTQAKGVDPTPDAFYKAMTKVRVTGQSTPNLIVMHPNDWMNIRLLRTTDGIYIWGNPSDSGPERMWGMAVSQAQALTQGTGLVVDTQFVELAMRRGLDIQVSNSHGTFFIEGKQAIRADLRAALVVYRPTAICTVTGI